MSDLNERNLGVTVNSEVSYSNNTKSEGLDMNNSKEANLNTTANSNELCACCGCGKILDKSKLLFAEAENGDKMAYCEDCAKEKTVICDCCGKRVLKTQTESDPDIYVCNNCYRTHDYTYCSNCGRLVSGDEICSTDQFSSEELCKDCFEEIMFSSEINEYSYKPDSNFLKTQAEKSKIAARFFGVELEVESIFKSPDELAEDADSIFEMANSASDNGDVLYIKIDGSLENGFEIVTHPMTMDYHLKEMNWEEILTELCDLDYTSGDSDHCGLHIHINRDSLGNTPQKQNEAICRIIYFMEKYWDKMVIFSRRDNEDLERWAKRRGAKAEPSEYLSLINEEGQPDRYYCVNTLNKDTVEFRMFNGTIDPFDVIASILFVNELCELAVSTTDEEIKAVSWNEFLYRCYERRDDNKFLFGYLYQKGILLEKAC